MAKKYFSKHLMSSEFDGSKLVKGRFYDKDAVAEIHDGALVVIGDLEDHAVYAGLKDLDTRAIKAPTAITDKVAIVDISNVSEGEIMGVRYREGIKTVGLTAEAGKVVRVRKLAEGDSFYLASGNFVGAPEAGKYAIPTANSTLFTIAETPTAGALAVKIELALPLTEGTVNTDTKYLCTVVQ